MRPQSEDRFKAPEEQMTMESLLRRGQQLHSQAIFALCARIIARIAPAKTNDTQLPKHLTPDTGHPR